MKRLILLIAASILLSGCATLVAQNPGQGLSPVNAAPDAEDARVLLRGHDVVSYFTEKTHRLGDPALKSVYKGVTFRFSTPAHQALFDAAPERYIPQFGGFCTNGIVYSIAMGGNADTWEILDGKLYIFGGQGSHDAFMLDVPRNLALANKYWTEEIAGNNAMLHNAHRLVFHVPHWKTSAELAAEVARARR